MKIWCRECENHKEYAVMVYAKDENEKQWIDVICLDCNNIVAAFEANPGEVHINILETEQ